MRVPGLLECLQAASVSFHAPTTIAAVRVLFVLCKTAASRRRRRVLAHLHAFDAADALPAIVLSIVLSVHSLLRRHSAALLKAQALELEAATRTAAAL